MDEVRVAAFFPARTEEINQAVFFVDTQDSCDVTFAGRNRILELSVEIVKVKLAPIVPLGKPDHLIRVGQVAPVDGTVTGLVVGWNLFLQNVVDVTGRGIRYAQILLFTIARRGYECEMCTVRTPLNVGPDPAANHVIA